MQAEAADQARKQKVVALVQEQHDYGRRGFRASITSCSGSRSWVSPTRLVPRQVFSTQP